MSDNISSSTSLKFVQKHSSTHMHLCSAPVLITALYASTCGETPAVASSCATRVSANRPIPNDRPCFWPSFQASQQHLTGHNGGFMAMLDAKNHSLKHQYVVAPMSWHDDHRIRSTTWLLLRRCETHTACMQLISKLIQMCVHEARQNHNKCTIIFGVLFNWSIQEFLSLPLSPSRM